MTVGNGDINSCPSESCSLAGFMGGEIDVCYKVIKFLSLDLFVK